MIDFKNEIEKLLKEKNLTYADIDNLEEKDEYKIEAYFKSIDYVASFFDQVVLPITRNIINPTEKENYVNNTLYRIYCIILSVLKLNQLKHFQTISSSTRTFLELYIDLVLLTNDILIDTLKKYSVFPEVQKYCAAKRISSFYDKNKSYNFNYSPHMTYIKNNETKIIGFVKNIWGIKKDGFPKFPNHWSGLNTWARAIEIDKYFNNTDIENLYIQVFPYFNWYVHSDPTGTIGLDENFFNHLVGVAYVHCHRISLLSLKIVCNFFHIDKTYPNYMNAIENMTYSPGFFMLERKIKGNNKSENC